MIKEDSILTLADNKEYYVMNSIINDNNNYILIGEIDKEKGEISDNVKVMYYDNINKIVRKVTDPKSLFQLSVLFSENVNTAE